MIGIVLAVALNVLGANNMPLVEATIDGEKATLLLDTGASHTTLDSGFAARFELETIEIEGATNVKAMPKRVKAKRLKLGDEELEGELILSIDLSHLSAAMGTKVDGILGMNHLGLKSFIISLKNSELVFEPSKERLQGFKPLLSRSRGTTREAIIKTPNGAFAAMLIDTGSTFTFIDKDFWPEGEETISLGATDVNASSALKLKKGKRLPLVFGRGNSIEFSPVLSDDSSHNQLGSDFFKEHDLYFSRDMTAIK